MAKTESKSSADSKPAPTRSAGEVIIASATDAFGSAIVLWLLGGVAVSMAGSFAGQMIPSLPPAFAAQQSSEADHAGHHFAWRQAMRGGALVFFFAIFFIHSLWLGFHGGETGGGSRIKRILSNLRENWFGLIVGNAIGAWAATLVLGMVPDFSPVRMLGQWVWEMILPVIKEFGDYDSWSSNSASLGQWLAWYQANQIKLTFWILYLSGALDDLGVPNFKTLARWAWRRMKQRKGSSLPVSVERGGV
jgi:hypothetical protein